MKKIAAILVVTLLFFSFGNVKAGTTTLKELKNEAVLDFPTSIQFTAVLKAETEISRVKLHYGTNRDACGNVSALAFPEITAGKQVTAAWEWDMRQSGGEPPGTTIWWQWETIDANGNSSFSERQEVTWLDDIHNWKTLSEGKVRLHYYYPDEDYGIQLKDAATEALDRLSQDIGIESDQPIDLYIYSSTEDMRDAVFYEPGWTGGLAYPEYNILIIGIDPVNLEWGKKTEAHEMTHVLVGDYTFSCLGSTPTWLSEGLAVYGEGGPTADEISLFDQYSGEDALLSFAVLSGGFSEDPNEADLSYSQSYFMVDYLIQTYGKEKTLNLLLAIKDGGELGESLMSVYDFDLTGFETEWRASLGLSPRESAQVQSTQVPTVIPTIIPIEGAQSYLAENTTGAEEGGESNLNNSSSATNATSLVQTIIANFLKFLPWILGLGIFFCVLLLILFLVLRGKGGQK